MNQKLPNISSSMSMSERIIVTKAIEAKKAREAAKKAKEFIKSKSASRPAFCPENSPTVRRDNPEFREFSLWKVILQEVRQNRDAIEKHRPYFL